MKKKKYTVNPRLDCDSFSPLNPFAMLLWLANNCSQPISSCPMPSNYFILFHLPNIEPVNDVYAIKIGEWHPVNCVFDNNHKSKMESTSNIAKGVLTFNRKLMHIENWKHSDSCCHVNIISYTYSLLFCCCW